MKINVSQIVKTYKNEDMVNAKDEVVTYRDAIYFALNAFGPQENPTSEDKKMSFGISSKLFAQDEADLTVEEAAFIKKRSGIVSSPLEYGRICELIDNAGNSVQAAPAE